MYILLRHSQLRMSAKELGGAIVRLDIELRYLPRSPAFGSFLFDQPHDVVTPNFIEFDRKHSHPVYR